MKTLVVWLIISVCSIDASYVRTKASTLNQSSTVQLENGTAQLNRDRNLAVVGDFVSLTCNNVMAQCKSWTGTFGTSSVYTSRVTIPCGACYNMDFPGEKLTFQGGLDIRGKLVFPDGYKLTVESNIIVVQGELEITSTKSVNGSPDVTFVMVGDVDQFFTPYADNQNVCEGMDCKSGKKAITVAGGKVTLRGLPPNTPTWTRLYDVSGGDLNRTSTIVVPDVVYGKWGKGADILITSHTINWLDQQPRTIIDVTNSTEPGYVNLVLNSSITRPVTLKDSPDFAVEVALLSRNVLFLGGPDATTFHGGHFMIMNTPRVVQTIEGVEFRNFGQQGTLGRYPLHIHMCNDVTGSVFSKNTIRRSNQRCIVVHATNNLLVQENIAFDTKGHCFILEDGIETGNRFVRNLGAMTGKPSRAIPNMGTNGVETDQTIPSTFWITNPTNSFEGNVGAGSEGSAFWFELLKRGDRAYLYPTLEPKKEPLTLFKDSVAHSNKMRGVRTYPTGYIPDSFASFIGVKAYKNIYSGMFIHNSFNIEVIGGVYADNNNLGIDIDKAESIVIQGAKIIGQTGHYTKLMQTQTVKSLCVNNTLVGLESHTWKTQENNSGVYLDSLSFSGFNTTACGKSPAFRFDVSTKLDMFELPATFRNVSVEKGTDAADFCWTKSSGIRDAYAVDLTGSMGPNGGSSVTPATLVSNEPNMLQFIDSSKCTEIVSRCYKYCRDTCIRAARFEIESSGTEGYSLKVCRKSNSSSCTIFPSHYWPGNEYEIDVGRSTALRVMSANLPQGQYNATMLDSTGSPVWPTFVTLKLDETYCANTIKDGDVAIVKPAMQDVETTCANLIRNGGAEASQSDPLYWHHRWGGIQVAPGMGIGGSNAVTNIASENGGNDAVGQFLETRCLSATVGRYYEFSARVKLVKTDGSIYRCDPLKEVCPNLGIATPTWTKEGLITIIPEYDRSDFQLVHGLIYINADVANADSVFLFIERGRTDVTMFVDDMSLKLVPLNNPASPQCMNVVYNGNFQTRDSRFWNNDDAKAVEVIGVDNSTTSFALKTVDGSMRPQLRLGCLSAGVVYEVAVQYQIRSTTGTILKCDPTSTDPTKMCPEVRLYSYKNQVRQDYLRVAATPSVSASGDWGVLTGYFVATSTMASADDLELAFMNLIDGKVLIVKDATIRVKTLQESDEAGGGMCEGNLILNSMMEAGFNGYWLPIGGGVFEVTQGMNSSKAFRYSDRTDYSDGPAYRAQELMDVTCLTPGSIFEVNADIKIFNTTDGSNASCDPDFNCPKVRLLLRDNALNSVLQYRMNAYDLFSGAWQPTQFNHFRQSFSLPSSTIWDGTVKVWRIEVRDFPAGWDIVIDNFTMQKVSRPSTAYPTPAPTHFPTIAPSATPTSMPTLSADCSSNLLANSQMESGYQGYWTPLAGGVFGVASGVNSTKAIRYSDRTTSADGPAYISDQHMDLRCLSPGATYEFNADMKLVNTFNGSLVSCNPTMNCPKVRVFLRDKAGNIILQYRMRGYDLPTGAWQPTQFNHFRQSFTLPTAWDGTVKVWDIDVRDFPVEWDIIIDNFTLKRTAVVRGPAEDHGNDDFFTSSPTDASSASPTTPFRSNPPMEEEPTLSPTTKWREKKGKYPGLRLPDFLR